MLKKFTVPLKTSLTILLINITIPYIRLLTKKPIETFFGRACSDPSQQKKDRLSITRKILEKQDKDLKTHNTNRTEIRTYIPGDVVFVKGNKRLGNKLTPRYKQEVVKEDKGGTIVTESKKKFHKNLIKN